MEKFGEIKTLGITINVIGKMGVELECCELMMLCW